MDLIIKNKTENKTLVTLASAKISLKQHKKHEL